jgi:hypothetical protein
MLDSAEPTGVEKMRPENLVTPGVGAREGAGAWGHADARIARAAHEVARLRYFRDLLVEGYRTARTTDLPSNSLRAERVDLGIELPELDTVALWSTRRQDDGAIAIPFIEYILGRFVASLDEFCAQLQEWGTEAEMMEHTHALEQALGEANHGGAAALALPSLSENFLPEPFLERLCGPSGLLERALARCETLLGTTR